MNTTIKMSTEFPDVYQAVQEIAHLEKRMKAMFIKYQVLTWRQEQIRQRIQKLATDNAKSPSNEQDA